MGQCVSRKAGTVIAASSNGSPSYRIMEKPNKNKGDNRISSKRGTPYTRGTAMSFGFRRRPASGIPMPVNGAGFSSENPAGSGLSVHPRSKSAGHEHDRRKEDHDSNRAHNASGRSTPRLAPPKKEASGTSVRTNRFGFRQPQATRYTDRVGDMSAIHNPSHSHNYNNHDKTINDNYCQNKTQQGSRRLYTTSANSGSKLQRPSPVNAPYNNNNPMSSEFGNQRSSFIPEPISKYTLHTSHLPQPQFAVRMNESNNSKTAKTAANQSRKISTVSKCTSSSKEGSGTEDSGVGSQFGCLGDDSITRNVDYLDNCSGGSPRMERHGRPRNLRMVVNGKSFDVRDVNDDSTVTEISVITLPKSFANVNLNTGLVRERTSQYQRVINKDNRYNDSISVTSSEGYDEGLGEEKAYKDRSRYEKVPSVKSDFSPPSSDDPEYGHGEAMADEYSFSSSDECRANYRNTSDQMKSLNSMNSVNSVNSVQAKNGTLPKVSLRSVLLTIEDPAFAAAAATTTTMIDDETSPVDSLFDSPTASITQSDGKVSRKDNNNVMEKSGNTIDDDSPGTPTNASNSLSLSEGREFFDDEIADQPGLTFDDGIRVQANDVQQTGLASQINENSYTLVESHPKTAPRLHGKSIENSPMHGRRLSHAGSVDTLSPCESIASDDLMLDYERSDASSYEESTHRIDSNPALHELDDATILSELEAQGEEVMREWSCLLGAHHPIQQTHSNSNNNNVNANNNNNNHNATTESGIGSGRTSRLLRSRSGTDSPRSLDSVRTRGVSSPLRPPRNIQSPSLDSGDEGSLRLERGTYQYMFQDIVSIKTMLLKLKRVLQEAETLNPFDNSMKNGLFYNLNENGTTDASTSPGSGANTVADELADLRRQNVFLQGQLEDKDRTIHLLQVQMTKYQGINGIDSQCSTSSSCNSNDIGKETCNAATQTDKVRPVSAGPSLLQSLPQDGNVGPLVSWSDLWNQPHPPSPTVLSAIRTLRKPSDHSPRLLRSRQDQARNEHFIDKPIAESSPIKKTIHKSKDLVQNRSSDLNSSIKEAQMKPDTTTTTPTKSSIPMPRRLTQQTLIPRAARAVSATGRSHNP